MKTTPRRKPKRLRYIRKRLIFPTAHLRKGETTPTGTPPRPAARSTPKPKQLTPPNNGKKVASKRTSPRRKLKEERSSPKDESHHRKYALKKKSIRTLFPVADIIKARPGASLTAHQTYVSDTVPKIIKRAEKGKPKRCVIGLLAALEDVEFSLINRLGIVSNLKMEAGAPNHLMERTDQIRSLVADKLLDVQQLIEKEQRKRDEKRQELKNQRGRFVCCSVCDIKKQRKR